MGNLAGNWLIGAGLVLVLIGLVVKTGLLGWFGHLPGDLRIERNGIRVFFPITSMAVLSLVLSLLLSLIRRFFS